MAAVRAQDQGAVRPEPEDLRVWRDFLRAHALLVRRLDHELRAAGGVSLDVYDVLVALSEAPDGRLRMQQLAAAVLITRSSCTRLVDRMVRDGLVERQPAQGDGRGVDAVITAAGRRAFRRAAAVHLRGVQRHFAAHLGSDGAAALGAALNSVLAGIDDAPVADGRAPTD